MLKSNIETAPELMIDAFDEIYSLEDEVVKMENSELLRRILGYEINVTEQIYMKLSKPMKIINDTLMEGLENISTIQDFDKMVKFVKRLENQKHGFNEYQVYGHIIDAINVLLCNGFDKKEIIQVLKENEAQSQIYRVKKVKDFLLTEDRNEAIIKMDENYDDFFIELIDNPVYKELFVDYFYPNNKDIQKQELKDLIDISKILKQNPYIDFNEISIEHYYDEESSIVIYKTINGKKFAIVDYKELCEFENQTNSLITVREDGRQIRIYSDEEGTSFYDNQNGDELEYFLDNSTSSNFELTKKFLEERLNGAKERCKRLIELEAPDIIIQKEKEIINEIEQKLKNLKAKMGQRRKKIDIQDKEDAEV